MVFSFARSVVFTALVLVFAASYSECQSACSIPCVQNVVDVACSQSLCGHNAHASDRIKYLCHSECKDAIMDGQLGDCLSEQRMPRIRQKLIENTLKALVINTCRANSEADDKQASEATEIPRAITSMIDRLGVLAPKEESTTPARDPKNESTGHDDDSIAAHDGQGDNATDTGTTTDDKWEVNDPIYSDDSFKASGPLASIDEVFDIDNLDFNMTRVEDDVDTPAGDLEGDEDVSDDVSVEEMKADNEGKKKRKDRRKAAKKNSDDDEEEESDDDDDEGRKKTKTGGRRKSKRSSDDEDDDDEGPRKRRLNDSDDDEESESDDDEGNGRRKKAKNGKRKRKNRGDDDDEEEESDDDDEGRKVTGGRKKHQPRRGNKGKNNQKGGKRNGKNKGKGKKNQKKNKKKGNDDDDESGDDDDSAPTSPVPSTPSEANTTVPVGAQPDVAAPPVVPIDPPTDQANEGMVKGTAPAPSGPVFEGGVPYDSDVAAPPLSDPVPMPEIESVVEPVSGGVTEGPMSEDEQILLFLEKGMN